MYISETFSEPNGSLPVRIAVIDTGCNLKAPIFDIPGYETRLRGHWKDWLDEFNFEPRDEHGHGTEIVSLLLRILPNAEIFVARVARSQADLDTAGGIIVKVGVCSSSSSSLTETCPGNRSRSYSVGSGYHYNVVRLPT